MGLNISAHKYTVPSAQLALFELSCDACSIQNSVPQVIPPY